ncbi:MAG: bifunctional metallophosphatase/5'-nucleotidase [Candidatus Marinimicrobia bacterium]|jgi:2',3'-cyclic-nucleotide 2'-phosphodiesterase (5'-nucleotidase family)|nr:bifunctional metallophosphatase/5'-nucleotidase [Candidatus Neomarinimicrobiota bacterium]MBT3633232.1 bifunctional metallophosphatase/5'-nucleotidase [Candidatus Neomarinimicrobiota bacterium]MBT3682167.1 bifunctional metallophosphatase/5'-nucleotidase [Candidatus Neomarinimicrobiota bacterium]MBT3758832.1 bifunctional metallophosphatase/5'-nucleotidase [Candidatus Neomarinimicrobiota bacterium]MBT3895293.1 bifunctional metallophosphatase/5'-nucleotidase [Candidatus Neomarinimicrobiota bact
MKKFLPFIILLSLGCGGTNNKIVNQNPDDLRRLTILYTNDEHGWMLREGQNGGAAQLMNTWIEEEGYVEDGPFLILSGGDMWTGPAISTWFKGESMVDVMNSMNYDAAAIGNHEFDFNQLTLLERSQQANFPLLSSNMRSESSGEIVNPALPYIIKTVNDISVGIIGLTATEADDINFPENVAGIDFIDYQDVLYEIVPQIKSEGAELIIIVGHICSFEITSLVPLAKELGIALIGGGHCHETVSKIQNGIGVMEGGSYLSAYAKAEIDFDIITNTVVDIDVSTHNNTGLTKNSVVDSVISIWQGQMDSELSQVIGYVAQNISSNSDAMYNLITDAWLWSYPNVDIAITNTGGIRADMPPGDITFETWVGILPFENFLYVIDITGEQLIQNIPYYVIGGMTTIPEIMLIDGTPIHPDSVYSVLVTDYIYSTSEYFQTADPDPLDTSIHWRQPVIDWIQSLNTNIDDPLDNYLDYEPRQ